MSKFLAQDSRFTAQENAFRVLLRSAELKERALQMRVDEEGCGAVFGALGAKFMARVGLPGFLVCPEHGQAAEGLIIDGMVFCARCAAGKAREKMGTAHVPWFYPGSPMGGEVLALGVKPLSHASGAEGNA